jgi:hypothetical protein
MSIDPVTPEDGAPPPWSQALEAWFVKTLKPMLDNSFSAAKSESRQIGKAMEGHMGEMRESVQNLITQIAAMEATINAQKDTIASQEKRISALEAALKDRPVVPPAGGKESAWSRPLLQKPTSAPPDQAGYDLQFRISGIPEESYETDRQLAVAVKTQLTKALEANNAYAQKEQDKAEFTIVSARRMGGKADPSRPRLALISVSSSFDASSLVRNRRFLKNSGVAALDFLSPEEMKLHKENLPAFLEAKKDPSKWVSFNRGVLKVRDKATPSGVSPTDV